MEIILLSGGSGKRLWPLSNDIRSKQFLRLLKSDDGKPESMIQRVYRQIRNMGDDTHVMITTSFSQKDIIMTQLGNNVEVITEPERRDTFPAVALATAYLRYERQLNEDECIVVMPVDPYTNQLYFETLKHMEHVVKKSIANIVLMGIGPTYPSEKYGYILPGQHLDGYWEVNGFIEKPNSDRASEMIKKGAVWNAGVFAFRLGYMIEKMRNSGLPESYSALRTGYHELKKTSFDYEIVEKESSLAVVPFFGEWKDLGTWNTFSEEIGADMGSVIRGEGTERTQIINELDIPLIALGVKDMVIVATSDGILVTGKEESSHMKSYVEQVSSLPKE